MFLTDKEKAWLQGDGGQALSLAMQMVTSVGEAFGAERLIPIASAHILGHYGSIHQAGIDLLQKLVEGGGRVSVPTTVDPSSVDSLRPDRFRIPADYLEQQERLTRAVAQLGVIPSWSCTPYLAYNVPRFGQNVAWAESSAVAYANSVIGARTNRTPFGLDTACAVTGRAPEFGLYLRENRRATVLFEVHVDDLSDLDYHTLGALVGSRAGARVPAIQGLPASATNDRLKTFGAGAASAGSVALFHAIGLTPEACTRDPFEGKAPGEVVEVKRKDLMEMEARISTAPADLKVDLVTLGCPLLSVEELKGVAGKMQGRRVRNGIHFWIYLGTDTYEAAARMGLTGPLEKAGIWFSTGTCATISPVRIWGFRHVMTNSAKCALVVPSEHDVAVSYRDADTCIRTATEAA